MNIHASREPTPGRAQDALADLHALVSTLGESSRSPNTRRAYAGAWGRFHAWATGAGVPPLPASPETVALYAAHLYERGRKAATIEQAIVAISQRHIDAGFASPRNDRLVARVLRGVRRKVGREPKAKAPLLVEHLEALTSESAGDPRGVRDLAILTLGFFTGLRRAELVALNVEDVQIRDDSLIVNVRRSKTDVNAEGRAMRVEARDGRDCPVRALRAWLALAAITEGPVFRPVTRSGKVLGRRLDARTIARLVKSSARRLGLDEARFAAHSMRSGYATSAASDGVPETRIMKSLGHSSLLMTARYIRLATAR